MSRVGRDSSRDAEWYRLWAINGRTVVEIGAEYNVHEETVRTAVKAYQASMPAPDRREMIDASIELLKDVQRRAIEIAEMAPAPVFVGKDGSLAFDETGRPVKDYSGRIRALELAVKVNAEVARRLGLDAATKTESTASVRYEIVGVDLDQLS